MASHGAEVAARVALVRRLVDAGKKRRMAPTNVCANGLETIERWLRGEPVTYEQLEKLNGAASAEYDRAFERSGKKAQLHAQLASALVNLACFAARMTGWKSAATSVFDSVADGLDTFASKRTDPRELAKEVANVARKLDTDAMKKLEPPLSAAALKKGTPAKLRAARGDAIGKRLERAGAMIDPALRGASVVRWPAIVAFDERWGGTIFAGDGADEWNVLFGTFGCKKHKTRRAKGRVPVARGPGDEIYYADARGEVFTGAGEPYAPDLDRMVARIVEEST